MRIIRPAHVLVLLLLPYICHAAPVASRARPKPHAKPVTPTAAKAVVPAVPTATPAQQQATADALKALRRLHAATAIGVTPDDYHERLINASADVTEDLRIIPAGTLRQSISDALQAYSDAWTLWQKTLAVISSIAVPDQLTVDQSINVLKGADVDDLNNDLDMSAIEARYGLPKAEPDVAALQASLDQYKQEVDIFDKAAAANVFNDPQITKTVEDSKIHCANRLRDRDAEIERTALKAFTTKSLAAIWAVADQLTQKAEPTPGLVGPFQAVPPPAAPKPASG